MYPASQGTAMVEDQVPQQRTSMSMGRVRPVHKENEHTWREDGSCECGRHNLAKGRAYRAARERAGFLSRSEMPAQPTAGRSSLDKIEQNAGLDGDLRY